ncbi:conserved hypothetical protein [Fibrobacter succinogenes subsp. succinogenes S85]|uniref:MBG domain-containing protein n=1 Tax=Fibrobacter succinogenes (strain ATCC 19169 / S85) TaxID=59374 RepID=C9RLE8_FIBSS|nr:MBG domain-containing protein [Fibrobacter succinogenes]ACX74095.1 hypothetical protein Fisuc_0483 [Fibrobacter succinogenes subsp. succinogenes S85]ADL26034.1 conserved hypothetical protein [Fibrobacter succinogenes subsp. succinogenes S85]
MIKKIAMFALAVSMAFSGAFADSTCTVAITPSLGIFSGNQIKPTVTRVMCDDVELTDFSVTYGENINAGANAGTVYVTVKGNTDPIEKKFDIEQKPIKILIDNAEKEKGTKDPVFTWKLAEVKNVNAKELANLQAGLEEFIELTRNAGEEVYTYPITLADGIYDGLKKKFPNYDFSFTSGEFTITKTKVTVVVTSTAKVYGQDDPEQFEYTIHGNIEKSDYTKLGDIVLSRPKGEDVTADGYLISVTVENMETDDYYVETVPGTFVIQPAPVNVVVDDVEKIYGDATPEYTYKVTGLIGSDKLKDVTISCAKCVSTGLENVGEYAVTASVKAASNPNYKVTTKSGTLTVTPKAATVTMNNAEKTYGEKDPKFTYEAEGLVTASESLASPTIARAKGENVGTYKVSVEFAEGANPNYTLTVKPGTLTINQKAVTLVVDNITKKYGEKDPELTYTVSGIASFDGVKDELKGVALKREAGEDAGDYAITATVDDESNPNYIVSTKDGQLTITANDDKIVVTITGHVDTVEYDGKEHSVKGYDISSNSEAYSLKYVEYSGESAVAGTDAGKYTMGLSAADFKNTSVNYPNVTFNIADGVLVVNPRALVVSANADTITYGDETPTEFTWSVDRLLEGDELDNIHVSLNKTGLLAAGDYELTFDKKSPTNTNYEVTKYETNTLTVKQKIVTVTVNDTSKFYSEADPEKYTYTVSGLLDGDELPELYMKRQQGEDVLLDDETYSISGTFVEAFDNPNYIVKIRQGHFTIKPCTQRITVAIYGDNVIAKYDDGNEVTALKSFDVSPMRIPGEPWLPEEFAYKKEFVSYKGDSSMTATELGVYPMGLVASDFVNISPNFENVNFVVSIDGTFKITDEEISIAAVKGRKAFGISSMNRRIQVNGSTVGKRFAVLDLQGRVIRKGSVESSNFEIPVPSAGVYMVRVGSSAQKILVK